MPMSSNPEDILEYFFESTFVPEIADCTHDPGHRLLAMGGDAMAKHFQGIHCCSVKKRYCLIWTHFILLG